MSIIRMLGSKGNPHGAAGVFFLDVEPAQRVQHHQAAALGGALEAVEPLRGHDVGQAADQRLDQQAVSHGLPFLGAEVRPKGVQAVMNGGGRVFGGQVDHRAGGQFAQPIALVTFDQVDRP